MNDLEHWSPIPSCPGYEASDLGRIRSWCWTINKNRRHLADEPRIKAHHINGNGYCIVGLGHRKSARVHVLIAEAFIGPKPHGMDVNHKDGNKQNNRADNLEYVTRSENLRHAFRLGLATSPFTGVKGDAHRNTKIKEADVAELRKAFASGTPRRLLASQYGISYYTVWDITTGRSR